MTLTDTSSCMLKTSAYISMSLDTIVKNDLTGTAFQRGRREDDVETTSES